MTESNSFIENSTSPDYNKTLGNNQRFTLLLVLSVVVFIICLMAFDKHFQSTEITKLQAQAHQRLSVYQNSLLANIEQYEFLPSILADDPRIFGALEANAEVSQISPLLSVINERAGADEIFLLNQEGLTVGSSNYLSDTSFVNQNYAFRPYFKIAIEGGRGFYFAVGATSGKAGLFFAEPIILKSEFPNEVQSDTQVQEKNVIGVIVVKISLADIESSWEHSGEKVWLSDELGIVFLSYDARWLYKGLQPLTMDSKALIANAKQYGGTRIKELTVKNDFENYSVVSLPGENEHILFQQDIETLNWKINWLYSKDDLKRSVDLKKFTLLSIYVFLVVAGLWLLERIKSEQTKKQISLLIQQREEHQRSIIESTDAGLIILRNDGNITFINPQAKLLFRIEDDTLPDIQRLISPWRGIHATISATDATGIRSDGSEIPILVSTSAIGLSGAHEYLVTVHDVSELKMAQLNLLKNNDELEQRVLTRTEELRLAESELNQTQRLTALGRMSSAIAHEINQPITALSSYAASSELLLQRNEPEQVALNLAKIKALIERLSYISRQLRMVSGKRNTGLTNIRILPVIQYALDVLQTKIVQFDVDIQIDVKDQDEAQGNTMMLEQVVVNLIGNALDAVEGKNIRRISIIGTRQNGTYKLRVEDSGQGLKTDELQHLFEPFYSTKEVGAGLGLGLAISYSLVTDMGGKLSANSDQEEGTRFTIELVTSQSNHKNTAQPVSIENNKTNNNVDESETLKINQKKHSAKKESDDD